MLPETAAPAPGHFEAAYRDLAHAGAESIVVVSLSRLLSGSLQSAQLAARSFSHDLPVEVVYDTVGDVTLPMFRPVVP